MTSMRQFRGLDWLSQVYLHPERPLARHRDVLTSLLVKFGDWRQGVAVASISGLASFCGLSRSTVQRALRWGRASSLVLCSRRGNRAGDGSVRASEWTLVMAGDVLL
jgi:hypothetical protein